MHGGQAKKLQRGNHRGRDQQAMGGAGAGGLTKSEEKCSKEMVLRIKVEVEEDLKPILQVSDLCGLGCTAQCGLGWAQLLERERGRTRTKVAERHLYVLPPMVWKSQLWIGRAGASSENVGCGMGWHMYA